MNRYYGIQQDSRLSRGVKYYSSDDSSARGNEYEGDADDDSFASAQFSTGHSIAHSCDVPDFASVCSSKHSHSTYSKRRSRGGSRNKSSSSTTSSSKKASSKKSLIAPSKLRHVESQTSLAYSIDTTVGHCPSPLEMDDGSAAPVANNAAVIDQHENDTTSSLEQTPPGRTSSSNAFVHLRSPPKVNTLEFPNITPFGNGGFSPIQLEKTNGCCTVTPKLDHPYAMYSSPLRSSETSPTCSSHSTEMTRSTVVPRDIPSHIRSQRVEKIKSRLRSIEGNYKRYSEPSMIFRSMRPPSSQSQFDSLRNLHSKPTTNSESEKSTKAPRTQPLSGSRLAREAMTLCFLIYIVSIVYLNHKDTQARSLQLQVSQMKLMEQKLIAGMENEVHSMQLQIERYKLMSHALTNFHESNSKQLVPVPASSNVPTPSIGYFNRYYLDPFEAGQCELDIYEPYHDYSTMTTFDKSSIDNNEATIENHTPNPMPMVAPTSAPSVILSKKRNHFAPSLFVRPIPSNAITKQRVMKQRHTIPMNDFFLVQTMLD